MPASKCFPPARLGPTPQQMATMSTWSVGTGRGLPPEQDLSLTRSTEKTAVAEILATEKPMDLSILLRVHVESRSDVAHADCRDDHQWEILG